VGSVLVSAFEPVELLPCRRFQLCAYFRSLAPSLHEGASVRRKPFQRLKFGLQSGLQLVGRWQLRQQDGVCPPSADCRVLHFAQTSSSSQTREALRIACIWSLSLSSRSARSARSASRSSRSRSAAIRCASSS